MLSFDNVLYKLTLNLLRYFTHKLLLPLRTIQLALYSSTNSFTKPTEDEKMRKKPSQEPWRIVSER